jgi:hypothetical protein
MRGLGSQTDSLRRHVDVVDAVRGRVVVLGSSG